VRLAVPELAVVCAGEGPLRPALEQHIAYLGLRKIVRLAGHVPDVPALLARAHAAWTPGLRATVEAMAAGVPVASPWRELIGADLAVPGRDPEALAGRLVALLRDRKWARRCGSGPRRSFRSMRSGRGSAPCTTQSWLRSAPQLECPKHLVTSDP